MPNWRSECNMQISTCLINVFLHFKDFFFFAQRYISNRSSSVSEMSNKRNELIRMCYLALTWDKMDKCKWECKWLRVSHFINKWDLQPCSVALRGFNAPVCGRQRSEHSVRSTGSQRATGLTRVGTTISQQNRDCIVIAASVLGLLHHQPPEQN